MPVQRGLVPPALITSILVMVVCSIGWGALGVLSIAVPDALPTAAHRYLAILLATLTICSVAVHLSARIVRTIHYAHRLDGTADGDSYADGYADGLNAAPVSPAVSRLVRTPR